ncbi:hypothetical protein V6N11_064700 [Hibiscus sabdariffa]|uniref:Uncharacterized protein n=1 Tax=Hibiscus sabdariffa TaxID=183260 RepID=A0ABR2NBN9_9ROSI
MKTKQRSSKLEKPRRRCLFTNCFYIEPEGKAGGLALWWSDEVNVSILSASKTVIDSKIYVNGLGEWFCLFVYRCPSKEGRDVTWNLLASLRDNDNDA